MNRQEHAELLTKETGYKITAEKTCYTLWDGDQQRRWFPLYTVADVRRVVTRLQRLMALRTPKTVGDLKQLLNYYPDTLPLTGITEHDPNPQPFTVYYEDYKEVEDWEGKKPLPPTLVINVGH